MFLHYKKMIYKFSLQNDVQNHLLSAGFNIISEREEQIKKLINSYYKNNFNAQTIINELYSLAQEYKLSHYTVHFIFLACASFNMLCDYKRAGISEDVFWETIEDLKYKLFECENVKGVYGNFVIDWYAIFFKLDIFKIGRLEYERRPLSIDYNSGTTHINNGTNAFYVHIPSSGALKHDEVISSYRKAHSFFKTELVNDLLVLHTDTWLLYEENKQIFPVAKNIMNFMQDWQIIKNTEDESFSFAWRIFGKDYEKGNMPQDTYLQRETLRWINSGKKMGTGYGVILFDGETIVNKNNS